MNTKKKIVVSLFVLAVVLLVSIVTIVSVSAAATQHVTSKIKVNFRPSAEIIGSVSAKYSYGNVNHDMTTDGQSANYSNTYLWFYYSERPTTKTLQMQRSDLNEGVLEFSDGVRELVFEFTFSNTGYTNFTAFLNISDITTQKNMDLSYSTDNKTWTKDLPAVYVKAPTQSADSMEKCYVKVRIANPAFDAEFEGFFVWDLKADGEY